jgi:hypothetical protein
MLYLQHGQPGQYITIAINRPGRPGPFIGRYGPGWPCCKYSS